MKLINNIKDENYTQWIEKFVEDIIFQADIEYDEVIINDVDNERIYINVNGEDYIIRTWSYRTVELDYNNIPCAEMVKYTLFKIVINSDNSSHGEEINNGYIKIRWVNKL